jgi:tripartite-type tricarboxylate transporter receptor subunit TctC
MKAVRTLRLAAALCASALAAADGALAAESAAYPTRPIRLLVPFAPGGQPDIVARLLGPKLSEALGQPVIVDNRPGAGGTLGTRIVAGAAPDGHTLISVSAAHAIGPAVRANLGYDPVRDFAGISKTISAPYLLVVPPGLGVASVKELVALAKAKPGVLNFTSAGHGSSTHFGAEMFVHAASVDMVHVPQRGIPQALTDVMTGRVHFFMAPIASATPLVKGGKVRAIAVSTERRSAAFPELPTVAEAGVPGFSYDSWGALFAPAKTPRAVVARLNREVTRILALEEVRGKLNALGAETVPSSPAELDRFLAEQVATMAALAKKAGIQPE